MKEKRLDHALDLLQESREVMKEINNKNLRPEEDTALILNLQTVFLKHLVINTAIIADKLSEEDNNV